ncbi:MAG: serine/threonine protein kinase [Deltaproteobacteria bacterium]|nr:serine/threonine protein kinase [Deltaproteobacteria bacterium]
MSEAHAGMMVTPSVKLVRPLGEGGMGAVWVADHLALRTQVVVKFIASGLKGSKEAQERFSREAAAAAQVKSPHVVQTFDHGISDDGTPYIVMELLEGRDLGAYLDEHGRVPPELVVEIVVQLSRALDRAHERGIVHRDIKPGNIYLADAGRDGEVFVKLLDFGIAKGVEMPAVDSGTKTGSMIGSPFYMSPEQILGSKNVDHRSDLWSVGVVAFEALTGKKPFDAETMGGLAIRIHSEPLTMPSSIVPELPAAVDRWFERACARNVDERYTSAKELAADLARAINGEAPKSLDAPRLSNSSGSRRGPTPGSDTLADPVAPTLSASGGASTESGIVRGGSTQSKSRNRVLVLIGIVLVVPPLAFFGFSAAFKKDPPRVGADPSASGLTTTAAGSAPASSSASTAIATTSSTAMTTTSAPAQTDTVAPPGSQAGRPGHHGTRPRPKDSSSSHAATTPPTLTSSAPPVTPPKPTSSGHDIF